MESVNDSGEDGEEEEGEEEDGEEEDGEEEEGEGGTGVFMLNLTFLGSFEDPALKVRIVLPSEHFPHHVTEVPQGQAEEGLRSMVDGQFQC